MRTSGVRQRTKTNDDVFPSDVIIRKARDVVGKLQRVANEKCQDDVKRVDEQQRQKTLPSKSEILTALGRITEYQEKVCQYIDYLGEIVDDPPELEDINDLRRRQQRATEFSNRFARNHLYQIGRIVSLRNFLFYHIFFISPSPCVRRQKKYA